MLHRVLHLPDKVPVGAAGVELLAGAAVHRDHADAAVLRDARQPRRVQAGVVPAHAHLQRHRHRHRPHRRLQDARRRRLVAHQRGAGQLADRDLFHRAAEIDVDDVGAAIDRDPRRLGHRRRVAAGELHRGGLPLWPSSSAIRRVVAVLPHHRPGGDHLGYHQPGAKLPGEPAERQVGHARHRRQDDRRLDSDTAAQVDRAQGGMCCSERQLPMIWAG